MSSKAFAYLRVSSEGQREGDGFDRQELAIRNYAKKHAICIKQVFPEVVSGTMGPLERPVFTEMMEALLSNGVRTVLVENLSRLARDLMIQETILGDFQKRGFTVISVQEPDLCVNDPSRKLIRQVMGAFHEYEKQMIVLKLKASRERMKASTGKCEGNKEYGHYAGEQAVLKRILELKAAGKSANWICGELNRRKLSTRSGGVWFGSTVNKILRRVNGPMVNSVTLAPR